MVIRPEGPADLNGITELTIAAFNTLPISQHTEQFIVAALRRAGGLSLSLVTEIDGHLVGHVAFSPVTLSDGTTAWYGLGPVSVRPDYQRQGIGSALINEGLARLEAHGRARLRAGRRSGVLLATRIPPLPGPAAGGRPAGGVHGAAVRREHAQRRDHLSRGVPGARVARKPAG